MNLVTRRLRSLLIALAVLALSATAALAGKTILSTPHHQVASQQEEGDQQAEESEAPETGEAPESPDPSETDTTDASAATDTSSGVHPDNHGKLVSEAAQGTTPDGFDNHGAYVRTIAKDNHGHAGGAAKHTKTH